MGATVLPGAVAQLLAVSAWHEHNIVVYESDAKEIIICDDLQLMQVISVPSTSKRGPVCAAFNPQNGWIAIATGESILIYEAIVRFGLAPRWELAFRAADLAAHSVAWFDDNNVLMTTTTNECVLWSVRELRSVWSEPLIGAASFPSITVHSISDSKTFATRDTSSLVKLWEVKSLQDPPDLDFSYLAHPAVVDQCWFASATLLATVAAQTLFLWHTGSKALVASVPLSPNTLRPLTLAQDSECVLIQTASPELWQFKLQKASEPPLARELEVQLAVGFDNLIAFGTARRIYSVVPRTKSVELYDFAPLGCSKMGVLGGPTANESLCLSSFGNNVLVGGTLLRDLQLPLIPLPEQHKGLAMNFLAAETSYFVSTDATLASYRGTNQCWAIQLEKMALTVAAQGSTVLCFYHDRLVSHGAEDGLIVAQHPFAAELVSVRETSVLVWFERRLSLWNLSGEHPRKLAEADTNIEGVTDIKLGSDYAAVLANNGSETTLYIYDVENDGLGLLTQRSIGQSRLNDMQWSLAGEFLAVLTAECIQVFLVMHHEELYLVEEYETGHLEYRSLAWTRSLHLVAFNGKQLFVQKPEYYDADILARDGGINSFVTSLEEARLAINAERPIYHPSVIIAFLAALKPFVARFILEMLWHHLKFADTSSTGHAALDCSLGITQSAIQSVSSSSDTPSWPVEDFHDRLQRTPPPFLDTYDRQILQSLVRTLGDPMKASRLDAYALVYYCWQPLGSRGRSQARLYAWFSKTKAELLSSVDESKDRNLPYWLDRDALADITEQRAKSLFAKEREPTTVALPYVALRKLNVLQTLWRISSGHPEREKTLKFLSNDFASERWRLASQKNAYALLSKHRPEYAAAFFLLGDSVTDCCQVLVSKTKNTELAVTVARLYDGDAGKGMQALRQRCFADDPWLNFWCANLTQVDETEALDKLAGFLFKDPSAVFMYVQEGGHFDEALKKSWKAQFRKHGFSEMICDVLIDPLEHRERKARTDRSAPAEPASSTATRDDITTAAEGEQFENRPLPAHLKPAPSTLQLEPDMSAFGF